MSKKAVYINTNVYNQGKDLSNYIWRKPSNKPIFFSDLNFFLLRKILSDRNRIYISLNFFDQTYFLMR